jgi:hypothetical protein
VADLGVVFDGTNDRAAFTAANYNWAQGAHTVIQLIDKGADGAWQATLSAETNSDPAVGTPCFGISYTPANVLIADNTFAGSDSGGTGLDSTGSTAAMTFTAAAGVFFQGYHHPGGTAAAEHFRAAFSGGSWGTLVYKPGNGSIIIGGTPSVGANGVIVMGEYDGGDDANMTVYLQAIVGSDLSRAQIDAVFAALSTSNLLSTHSPGFCVDASDSLTNDLSGNSRNRIATTGTTTTTPPVGMWTFAGGSTWPPGDTPPAPPLRVARSALRLG